MIVNVSHSMLCILLFLFIAFLPESASRSVYTSFPSLDSFTVPGPTDTLEPRLPSKRADDVDPFNICPMSMRRIDCFYEYLSLYATLREQMDEDSPQRNRNIGKRGIYDVRLETTKSESESERHDDEDTEERNNHPTPPAKNEYVIHCPPEVTRIECMLQEIIDASSKGYYT